MNRDTNHIDELFRSELENAALNPPPGVWEVVSSQVASSGAAGSGITGLIKSVWTWVACGGIAITGTVAYLTLSEKNVPEETSLAAELNEIRKASDNADRKNEKTAEPGASELRPDGQFSVKTDRTWGNPPVTGAPQAGDDAESAPVQGENGNTGVAQQDHTHVHPHTPVPAPSMPPPSSEIRNGSQQPCPRQLNIEAEQGEGVTWQFKSTGSTGPVTWYFGDGATAAGKSAVHSYPARTVNYIVKAISTGISGCVDSAFVPVSIVVPGQAEVFIPDYLTPNGDGINDEWIISIGEVAEFNVIIFDQYNRQVFVTNNPRQGWNGKCGQVDCEVGTYTAVISYRLQGSSERVVQKSRILLKRQ